MARSRPPRPRRATDETGAVPRGLVEVVQLDHKDAWFDAVLPGTLALMRLIDTHRPALLASRHNAEVGGVCYHLSRPEPALHPVLQAVPAHLGLPLHRGEPEAPWIPQLADGIYRSLDLRDAYDHREVSGEHGSLAAATPPAPTRPGTGP